MAPGFYRILTDLGSIDATAEHPFWIQGTGWVEAQNIQPMDAIATIDGDVVATDNVYVERKTDVYNFSVANTRTYFAGAMGAWVHNALPCRLRSVLNTVDFPNLTLKKINPNELFAGSGTTRNHRQALIDAYSPHLDGPNPSRPLLDHEKWQHHHVIPREVLDKTPWLKDMGFDLDSIHNAMPLRQNVGAPPNTAQAAIHSGSHPLFSKSMENFLKKIDVDEIDGVRITDSAKQEMVMKAIERARESLNNGNPPLRNKDMEVKTTAAWDAVFQKVLDEELELLRQ